MTAIESDSLVFKIRRNLGGFPKYHEARQTLWESGSVTTQD